MKTNWLFSVMLYLMGLLFNIAIVVVVGLLVWQYAFKGYALGDEYSVRFTEERPDVDVEFILAEDTPVSDVAKMLEDLDIIRNQYWFRLEIFLKDSSTSYEAGTYTLNRNMTNTDVNVTLRRGPNGQQSAQNNIITIPEGYTVRDIAAYLESKELVTAVDFIEACETHEFRYPFLDEIPPERGNRLEGYLFPDTYFLSAVPDCDEIIDKMLSRFDDVFSYEYRARAAALGLTMDEVVTMASIVEKEVRVASERPLVAEVIYNRLEAGQMLEMCSTVLYAMDKRLDRLLLSDLQFQSPYNTYINTGLPVGPIANPGADCINAVLYPAEGNYMYFVLQDEETGEHFFTHDYDEFLNAKARYNQQF